MDPNTSNDIAQWHSILEAKEKALKEREDAFEQRLRLFEAKYPHAGKESDVLHLNVGGSTNIAVLRSTLTNFGESMLSSRFCGRWDDSVDKDKYGNFFIDEDPELFVRLLNYLRQCSKKKRNDITMPPPPPTRQFCWMLEYFDLMSLVYPPNWLRVWGAETAVLTRPSRGHNFFTIQTFDTMGVFHLAIDRSGKLSPPGASGFVAVLEKGSTGEIGWSTHCRPLCKVGEHCHSFLLDWQSKCFMGNGEIVRSFSENWAPDSSITIHCTYNLSTDTYSIQIVGAPAEYAATFKRAEFQLIPYISVIGKVTISNVSYFF